MATITFRDLEGSDVEIDVEALRSELHGVLLTPGEAGYAESCRLWNAAIDRRPAAVVRAAGQRDVMAAVRFAARHDLVPSMKGGGHNIAGSALFDGGLCIDQSGLREVHVDARRRLARVSAGATLFDFDAEAQAFGLAAPLGINSTTGVAGLTVGGGFGWLSRSLGATVDWLVGADVVTANGEQVHASEDEEPDLFWALRGGGGNFGVVTSFEFRLAPVGPEIMAGLLVHPLAEAENVMHAYRAWTLGKPPEEVACWMVLRRAPPLPFIPAAYHGREVLVLAVCCVGDVEKARPIVEPLRRIGRPLADVIGPTPYRDWQRTFDPLLAFGARNYWRSQNFSSFDERLVPLLVEAAGRLPSPETEIFVGQLGGALGRVAPDATAYPHRNAAFVMNVHTRWTSAADDRRCVDWARAFSDGVAPYATGGVYVNFVSAGEDRVAGAFGANYTRLAEVKRRYDPRNLFRAHQNIPPAPPDEARGARGRPGLSTPAPRPG